jgi:hypothetical protein
MEILSHRGYWKIESKKNKLYAFERSFSYGFGVETDIRDKTMLATIFASVAQNLEIEKFTLSQETPVIQILDASVFPLQKQKMSRLNNAILVSAVFDFLTMAYFVLLRGVRIWFK